MKIMSKIQKCKIVLSILMGIGIFAAFIYFSDINEITSILSKIHPIWIIFIVIIYSIDWLLRGYRWKMILEILGHKIELKNSVSLTILGNFANLIIPAKIGDAVRAFVIKRNNNIDLSKGSSSVVIDRILDFFGVAILAYVSFIIISKDLSLPNWTKVLIDNSAYMLIGGFVVIGIISKVELSEKYLNGTNVISRFYKKFVCPLFENIKTIYKPKAMIMLCTISIVICLFEVFTAVILLYSLGYLNNIPLIIAAIMLANLTKALPLTPGGIGPYEGTFAAIFMVGELSYILGLTIGILDHGIKNLYTVMFGIISLNYNGVKLEDLNVKNKNIKK